MQHNPDTGFVVVGLCSGPVGIHGAMKIRSLTDNPRRFIAGNSVVIQQRVYHIEGIHAARRDLTIKFVEVNSPDEAQKLNNENIFIEEGAVEALSNDQYYHFQLLGMQVTTSVGHKLGMLAEILTTGANDVYVVKGETEILIPAISGVVLSVDVPLQKMVVDLPDGL